MASISTLPGTLQALFGLGVESIAAKHHLIRRRRQFCATTLVKTFVLGYLHKPQASVADLALTAESLGVRVTPQAIDDRFQPALRDTLADLWQQAAAQLVSAQPRAVELLQRFTHVLVGDSTVIGLPDALAERFPGCGGASGTSKAALKIQVQYDLLHGTLTQVALEPARHADAHSPAVTTPPPAGALAIYDLGYFHLDRFRTWTECGVYWISKGLSQLTVTIDDTPHDLVDWLSTQTADVIDRPVRIGAQRVPGRLIACRVPKAVAQRRRQRAREQALKKSRRPSAQRLAACDWTVYLTNCPARQLSVAEVEVLYRLRWQIELLFKLWKSHNHLAEHRSTNPVRLLIELYARLIATLVQHWLLLTTGWSQLRLSPVKATHLIRESVPRLIEAWGVHARFEAVLQRLADLIPRRCRLDNRRKHPSSAQLQQNPALQGTRPLT